MIVMPTALSDEEIERLRRWDIPLVLVNHAARLPGVDTILTMNREGAFQATGHLLAHDYGRVALIAGPADSSEAQEREEGYRQALTQYAIPFDETLVVLGDFRQPGGYAAMNRLLAMPMPPPRGLRRQRRDGVRRARGHQGPGVAYPGRHRGHRLRRHSPGGPSPARAHDRASAVQDVARLAVERLLARLAGDRAPSETFALLATLVLRRSCGCATADHG